MPSTPRVRRTSMLMEDDQGNTYRVYRDVVSKRVDSLDGPSWVDGLAVLSTQGSVVMALGEGKYEIRSSGTLIGPVPGQEWS
jgi:hypothetical protein